MTRPSYWKACTIECEATQTCTECGRRKAPVGRDVAPEMANGMCDHECPGYAQDPKPGHLWPGEIAEMDRGSEESEPKVINLMDALKRSIEKEERKR